MKYRLVLGLILLAPVWLLAQAKKDQIRSWKPSKGTVCYMGSGNVFTSVPAPKAFRSLTNGDSRTKATANIEVTYDGFSPEAEAAFQYAVEIWESLIVSDVPIRVLARWAPLGTNVLGGASPGTYYTNFEEAPRKMVWYPVALAEKLARKDLNPTTDPDIVATFNSENSNWHFGVDSETPAGKFDMVSIVLHELGHGLGITHAYSFENGQGIVSSGFQDLPVVYETNLESVSGTNLVSGFQQPSTELGNQIVGGPLFYNSILVKSVNTNLRGQAYAPTTYSPGSSIAHLDESTYAAGNENSLMTPFINPAEKNHDPGPIAMAILQEMGWKNTVINHTAVANTEDISNSYPVTCVLSGEGGYDATSVKLNYTTNGTSFITVAMTATGNPNEFTAIIPKGNSQYGYYLSLTDADQRTVTKPGKLYQQGKPIEQTYYTFEAGPDTKAPFINHTPKAFITNTDPLLVEAIISDNIGVLTVMLEYRINGVTQPSLAMTLEPGTDSTFARQIDFPTGALKINDKIDYRIRAKDASITGNVRVAPSADSFFEVVVTGLEPTRDFYENSFNSVSSDFFGTGFSIATPAGFSNGAIHTEHPYPQGTGSPGDSVELIYQLKVPIRIAAENAVMKFDEIVLVEPGDAGSVFGSASFFDYVVVEGSSDGGKTWKPVADGYDSREYPEWLDLYNSAITNNISTASGDPSLFRSRTLDLSKEFSAGKEVTFRFRLHSDPLAAGWGWAIDNLKIQIDDSPPQLFHQQVDYLLASASTIELLVKATDLSEVASLKVEYSLNEGATSTSEFLLQPNVDTYNLSLAFAAGTLKAGDTFHYRIVGADVLGNEGYFPAAGEFNVAVVSLANPVSTFVTDFNSGTSDVSGNFFSLEQPNGFANKAMHSTHPYPIAQSLDGTSDFSWIIRKPIKLDATNPYLSFDEAVVIDYTAANPLKDNVVVEAAKDGLTWEPLEAAYGTTRFSEWRISHDNSGTPNSSLLRNHRIHMLASGKFAANDVVLIRFRLSSDATKAGWGWCIDNLSVQGPITGLVEAGQSALSIFPNPAQEQIQIRSGWTGGKATLYIFSATGSLMQTVDFAEEGTQEKELSLKNWAPGIYLAKLVTPAGMVTTKFLVVK